MAKTRLIQEIEPQILHQTGVFEVKQFSDVIGIYVRLPRLPWQRKFGNFYGKMAKTRLIQEIEPQCCTKQGVFEVRQFTGVFEIFTTPTPVSMVTKILEF